MTSRLAALLLLASLCVPRAARADGPTFPHELSGLWIARGPAAPSPPNTPETSWSYGLDGAYAIDAVPPLEERGQATVLERNGRRYHLRLAKRVRMNDKKPVQDLWIELSEDGRSLMIGNQTFEKKA